MRAFLTSRVAVGILLVVFALLSGTAAEATSFVVTSGDDSHDIVPGDGVCDDGSGRCTLRAALEDANALVSADTVVFAVSVRLIQLTIGSLHVTDSLSLIADHSVVVDGVLLPLYQSTLQMDGSASRVSGIEFYRAHRYAVEILGAGNEIDACTFLKCGTEAQDGGGILITGVAASQNTVSNSQIGIGGSGVTVDGCRAGIVISSGAHGNSIGLPGEPNLISGNATWGVDIRGGADNRIMASQIGPDASETNGPGNTLGGIRIAEGSRRNVIGGPTLDERNVISFNPGDGILIDGPGTDSTVVLGNLIGLQANGYLMAPNFKNGIVIQDGARFTQIGGKDAGDGNVISGNAKTGIVVGGTGTRGTAVIGNLIGTDETGYGSRYNGWGDGDGILIANGAASTRIGGNSASFRNTISGNVGFGVHITDPGTDSNVVSGNCIGTAIDGGSPVSNGTGVGILNGASENIVGGMLAGSGNVISGNRDNVFPLGAGVVIAGEGTAGNKVSGNIIGLDGTASVRMRNESCGIILGDGAQSNVIGGTTDTERNIISGNGSDTVVTDLGRGIHIFGLGTSNNVVIGNWIGVGYDGEIVFPNRGNGISVTGDANLCRIGGDTPAAGNRICHNRGHGIVISGQGTSGVCIRNNEIYANDSLGIRIRNSAQGDIARPVLTHAAAETSDGTASGLGAPPQGIIDVYAVASDPSGYGEGKRPVGSGQTDANGTFTVSLFGLLPGDSVTAVATDRDGNSSEFARNIRVDLASAVGEPGASLPKGFALDQNFPNPFNPTTSIAFALPQRSMVQLTVFDALGRKVRVLISRTMAAGNFTVVWDGCDDNGNSVASGIYFYRLEYEGGEASRKMLLIR